MKTSTLLAFLGGAAIGAGIALLFTTEEGEKARKAFKETLDKGVDRFAEKIDDIVYKQHDV